MNTIDWSLKWLNVKTFVLCIPIIIFYQLHQLHHYNILRLLHWFYYFQMRQKSRSINRTDQNWFVIYFCLCIHALEAAKMRIFTCGQWWWLHNNLYVENDDDCTIIYMWKMTMMMITQQFICGKWQWLNNDLYVDNDDDCTISREDWKVNWVEIWSFQLKVLNLLRSDS